MKDYKRLTKRTDGNHFAYSERGHFEVVDRLCELEDKIEQGRLIELPCKVGDTIYEVIKGLPIKEWEVKFVNFYDAAFKECSISVYDKEIEMFWKFWSSDFGKKLFLTKEEAEARLQELRGEK